MTLGCSKCRYSKRGCRRCKDPEFQARQQARANKAQADACTQKSSTRTRGKDIVRLDTEGPPAPKRRRNITQTGEQTTADKKTRLNAVMEPSADTREAGSVEQLLEAPAKKRIGSGLELGLAAGLLSLPGTDAMEQHSLEHRALDQRGQRPPASPDASLPTSTAAASCSDVSCSSTQVTGAAMHQSLRGEDLAEVVVNEEGPGEQKRRQRDFMELLHSKIQQRHDQRQQQGGTKDGPSLAAALASGARRKKVGTDASRHTEGGLTWLLIS